MTLQSMICFILVIIIETSSNTFGKKIRIIGGETADIKEFPHQVSFRYVDGNKHFCGGAIISNRHILTAAHCVKDLWPPYSNVRAHTATRVSTSIAGPTYKILIVHIHPGYTGENKTSFHNDIAVVMLDGTIRFNGYQKKIDLPTKDIRNGEIAMISGWGYQIMNGATSIHLQKAFMTIISKSSCIKKIGRIIHNEQICAFQKAGVGGCNGDSGGPLTFNGKVIGIISFVVPCATGVPDVFTKVYSYLDYIKSIIDK